MQSVLNKISFLTEEVRHNVVVPIVGKMSSLIRTSHNIIDPTSFSSVIRNAHLPLCCSIPGASLDLGTLISIYATFHSGGRRFRIDFYSGKCEHVHGTEIRANGDKNEEEIAFHFNPRIGESGRDVVVMNSLQSRQWRQEVREYESFPFRDGTPFQLMILVEQDGFKLAVDGKHLYEFAHRCDFRDIARLHIEGDIELDLLEFRKELRYLSESFSTTSLSNNDSSSAAATTTDQIQPLDQILAPTAPTDRQSRSVTSPLVPFVEMDPNLFGKPCDIYIAGMLPNHVREHLVINLANKEDPTPGVNTNIPVHISIRPDLNVMVRNTMTDGNWGEEELYLEGQSQMIPGTHFDLMISNRFDKMVVAVNGQPAFEYKHRSDPRTINALEITGGVVLTSIRYEAKEMNVVI